MDFKDDRGIVVWEVGDLVVASTDARFFIIQDAVVGGSQEGKVSLVNTATNQIMMTRDSIADLQADFELLFTVKELIKGGDLMIVVENR
jgi:hypothetical protein